MTITELRKRRGRLYLLVIDGEPAVTVDVRTWEESPYKVGSSLSEEELKSLLDESGKRRAKEKALYLLSLRDYSRAELERKLQPEAGAQTAAETAARMEELGLLDDEAYAERLARELIGRRHYPRRRACQELCARGIGGETARAAVEKVDSDDVRQALALIRKKYYNRLNEETRPKTMAALARFGFSGEVIRRAVEEFTEQETEENGD